MTYAEFLEKIEPLCKEVEEKLKNTKRPPFNFTNQLAPEQTAMLRAIGGDAVNPEDLGCLTFNMDNDTVKWTGYQVGAPEYVQLGFAAYAYRTIKNMNYTMNSMIGTSSENFARGKYNARIEQGGPLFMEIVQDLTI